MKTPSWEDELQELLGPLWDELRRVKKGPDATVDDAIAAAATAEHADAPAWQHASDEEKAAFQRKKKRSLTDTMKVALGLTGITGGKQSTVALLQLIAWDHRYLSHPAVRLRLRHAQVVGDREFLKKVGHALWQNERYGTRQMRSLRLMSRLLIAFSFGDERAYESREYRDLVFTRLTKIFKGVEVPESDPSMALLEDREHFMKHLHRLGLLGSNRT